MTITDKHVQVKKTRGQKLWEVLRERRDSEPVSMERARLLTASYKETDGLPIPIRRARAFEKIVSEIPIYIDDGQLLAGDFASRPMAAEWRPENEVESVAREIEEGKSPYNVRKEDMPLLREICDYWKGRSLMGAYIKLAGEDKEFKQRYERGEEGAWVNSFLMTLARDPSWFVPDYPKAINRGLLGILSDIDEEIKTTPMVDDALREKIYLLKAMQITVKAGIQYSRRYSTLAREMAKNTGGKRKKELERIAEVCARVPDNPARNFYEALQTMLFCHILIFWDTRPCGISPGRVDQYLYPFYKKDIEEGNLTREEAIELLECLRVKLSSARDFHYAHARDALAGEADFHNCTLGGQTADGRDATNELSFLWIEAAMRTRTPHPTLSIRVHENLSQEFALKAAELCSLGLGYPAWFGDNTAIPYLLKKGSTLEEARDYALAGCVVHVVPYKTAGVWPIFFNMGKVMEIALNDGVDPESGGQLGPKTGIFEDFKSYDDILIAFKEQAKFFITEAAKSLNEVRLYRSDVIPEVFASCFFDDCIKRGQSPLGGGCRYQDIMYLLPIGIIDVIDSLASIKQRVFDEGSVSKKELMSALKANFMGYENIRQLLLSAHKYGNDDDDADGIAAGVYSWLCQLLDTIDACYGVKYVNAPHSVAHHGPAGRKVGALPSGRLDRVALADGAISPSQGADVKGPTAVIKSAGKIDQLPILGTLLNMKFHPSALKSSQDMNKFLALINTYLIDFGGKHIQFNIVSRETLLDAQEHPERYRNLIVRVAGYSAFWVELDRTIQNEIISRTEHHL